MFSKLFVPETIKILFVAISLHQTLDFQYIGPETIKILFVAISLHQTLDFQYIGRVVFKIPCFWGFFGRPF